MICGGTNGGVWLKVIKAKKVMLNDSCQQPKPMTGQSGHGETSNSDKFWRHPRHPPAICMSVLDQEKRDVTIKLSNSVIVRGREGVES